MTPTFAANTNMKSCCQTLTPSLTVKTSSVIPTAHRSCSQTYSTRTIHVLGNCEKYEVLSFFYTASETTYIVSCGTLNSTHSLTHSFILFALNNYQTHVSWFYFDNVLILILHFICACVFHCYPILVPTHLTNKLKLKHRNMSALQRSSLGLKTSNRQTWRRNSQQMRKYIK